jgi:hypothetical protein
MPEARDASTLKEAGNDIAIMSCGNELGSG